MTTGRKAELLSHHDRLIKAGAAQDGALAELITTESIDAATSRIDSALGAEAKNGS
ncbi:hypothetical protein ACQP1U_18170 [Actinomycetota bacterium]